jgi:multisubunit Na+/H+ antiporter MnhC subunit
MCNNLVCGNAHDIAGVCAAIVLALVISAIVIGVAVSGEGRRS